MDKKIKEHKNDYMKNLCIDCPHCGADRPEHSCRQNCYSGMDRETCWKYKGYCSEKCKKYIEEELPVIRKKKEKMRIKCKCDEPLCGKCLGGHCQDDNCITHTQGLKNRYRKRNQIIENNVKK